MTTEIALRLLIIAKSTASLLLLSAATANSSDLATQQESFLKATEESPAPILLQEQEDFLEETQPPAGAYLSYQQVEFLANTESKVDPDPISINPTHIPAIPVVRETQPAPMTRSPTLTPISSRIVPRDRGPQRAAISQPSRSLPSKVAPPILKPKEPSPMRVVKLPRRLKLVPLIDILRFPLAVPAIITSAFGWRLHPISGTWRFHSGTDLGAPMGTPVHAAYAGRVELADWLGGYGLSVLLEHDQGKSATRYAHLSEVLVKPGQSVKQGTVIGLVGSTGYSTGPHLHFELLESTPGGWVAIDAGPKLRRALHQLRQVSAR